MVFSMIFFPLWILAFVFLLVIFVIAVWVWAIIHCLTSRLNAAHKAFWLIVILLLNLVGALLYFIFSKSGGAKMTKSFKGRKLLRSKKDRMIAGICGGIGEYLGIDSTVVRLVWVLLVVFSFGMAIIAYLLAWILIPEER